MINHEIPPQFSFFLTLHPLNSKKKHHPFLRISPKIQSSPPKQTHVFSTKWLVNPCATNSGPNFCMKDVALTVCCASAAETMEVSNTWELWFCLLLPHDAGILVLRWWFKLEHHHCFNRKICTHLKIYIYIHIIYIPVPGQCQFFTKREQNLKLERNGPCGSTLAEVSH